MPGVGARYVTQILLAISRRRLRLVAILYGLALTCAGAYAGPALAGYEEGMEAFSRGDYATAFDELRPLADKGDPNAQFTLGFMYDYGQGVRRNAIEAIWWYRKAAEQGSAVAQFTLGGIYESGRGAPKDLIAAYRWYSLAAESLPPGEIRNTVIERQDTVAGQLSDSELAHARELLLGQAAAVDADAASAALRRAGPDAPVDRDLLARIQTELARLGYHTGRADGVMNESTRGAILAFEIESGRDPSGTPSEALLDALVAVESTTVPVVAQATAEGEDPGAADPLEVVNGASDDGTQEADVAATGSPPESPADAAADTDSPSAAEHDMVAEVPETVVSTNEQEASLGTDDADAEGTAADAAASPAEADQLAALPTESDAEAATPPEERPATEAPAPDPQPDLDFVRAIQSELKRLGYDVGPIDGLAGRQTVTAIRAFEVSEHLPATGVLSEELLAQLRATQPPQTQLDEDGASVDAAGAEANGGDAEAEGQAEGQAEESTAELVADAVPEAPAEETAEERAEDAVERAAEEFEPPAESPGSDEAVAEAAPSEDAALDTAGPEEIAASDEAETAAPASAASDASDNAAVTNELPTASPADQTEAASAGTEPASDAPNAAVQIASQGETDQPASLSAETFEAPGLELRLAEPELTPSQPPELDSNRVVSEDEESDPAVEAPEPPAVALQAPTPLVSQQSADRQLTSEHPDSERLTVPQPPAAQAPTPLIPAAPSPDAQSVGAEPSDPQTTGPNAPAQQQTAALTSKPRPNESRTTEPGSTDPKPDLTAAAKRRVLN